jgi:hypothetical protein
MYDENRGRFPLWIAGVLLALVLIALSGGLRLGNPALMQQFAAQPPPAVDPAAPVSLPQVNLPDLPPETQRLVVELRDRLAGGAAIPPLTPTAGTPRVQLAVSELRRAGDRIQVRGTLRNATSAPLVIPSGAFSFRDSAGITYTTESIGGATLPANGETSFDLAVPLPADRGLALILNLPPDPSIEIVLVVSVEG